MVKHSFDVTNKTGKISSKHCFEITDKTDVVYRDFLRVFGRKKVNISMIKRIKSRFFEHLILCVFLILKIFPRLFVLLIFPQLTETGVIFLNTSEHLFHIRLGKMHQNRTSMGTVIGIVTLRKLIEELSS